MFRYMTTNASVICYVDKIRIFVIDLMCFGFFLYITGLFKSEQNPYLWADFHKYCL